MQTDANARIKMSEILRVNSAENVTPLYDKGRSLAKTEGNFDVRAKYIIQKYVLFNSFFLLKNKSFQKLLHKIIFNHKFANYFYFIKYSI